jgi:hypothetical protein
VTGDEPGAHGYPGENRRPPGLVCTMQPGDGGTWDARLRRELGRSRSVLHIRPRLSVGRR